MLLEKLNSAQLIHPPTWMIANVCYLTIMGSNAYGVSADNSDMDIYGFCMPPLGTLFPNAYGGEIEGFGRHKQRFNEFQAHHIKSPDSTTEYDFTIYNIAKYFQLLMECNPNILNSVWTPENCVIQSNAIGQMVRENRKIFLHKGLKHKFIGYAFSQKNKMKTKTHSLNEKRKADIEAFGYSTKFFYHTIRLLLEGEQLLDEGTLDIHRNRELLKAIRRGEWTLDQCDEFFDSKTAYLEEAYAKSKLPETPDEDRIKNLLMNCIEHHYGTISKAITTDSSLLHDLTELVAKYTK